LKISDLKNSRFLTKEDCEPPICVTISHVEKEDLGPIEGDPQPKYVMYFREPDVKPMVLNLTNGEVTAEITGSTDSVDWEGATIELYHDRNVMFAGKRTGGIRVRRCEHPDALAGAMEVAL